MPTPTTDTVPVWTAWLALPDDERDAFLRAASAFTAARTALLLQTCPTSLIAPAERPSMPALEGKRSSVSVARIGGPPGRAGAVLPSKAPETTSDLAIPLIGGAALDLAPSQRFMAPDFRQRWRPGVSTRLYCAGSQGLRLLMRRLGQQGYKVGTHAGPDLSLRMRDLNLQRYGSLWQGDEIGAELGFDSWMVEPLQLASVRASPGSPVTMGVEAIEVVLPHSMTPEAFDQAVARATCSATLAAFATSAAGRAACDQRGEDWRRFVRASPNGLVLEWSKEITLIRPRHDAERLVRLCETIVHDHVMAHDGVPIETGDPRAIPKRRSTTTAVAAATKATKRRR